MSFTRSSPVQASVFAVQYLGQHRPRNRRKDLQIVRAQSIGFVWTVLDGIDQWIPPGMHHVNRLCYLLTEVAHDWALVAFRMDRRLDSLTLLGLTRRISTLRSVPLENATTHERKSV